MTKDYLFEIGTEEMPAHVVSKSVKQLADRTKKYLKENPPINEKMIKIMMQQMGRTPSQKQINQMMKAMNKVQ